MQLKIQEVLAIYKKLKMYFRHKGKDHIAIFFYNGRMIFRTKCSFGKDELPGNLPDIIRQQFKLNESQFIRLRDCTMNYEEYVSVLKEKGIIER